eukprot:INCI7060.3.p3 GENE.INCI7060.3~~INCI7060.3.p3  ORF type:complete len:108 (+),score=29.38 INCI7060.3:568-891(+)
MLDRCREKVREEEEWENFRQEVHDLTNSGSEDPSGDEGHAPQSDQGGHRETTNPWSSIEPPAAKTAKQKKKEEKKKRKQTKQARKKKAQPANQRRHVKRIRLTDSLL